VGVEYGNLFPATGLYALGELPEVDSDQPGAVGRPRIGEIHVEDHIHR